MFHDTTIMLKNKLKKRYTYHRSINTYRDILEDLLSQKRCKEGIKCNHQKKEHRYGNNLSSKDEHVNYQIFQKYFSGTNLEVSRVTAYTQTMLHCTISAGHV